MVGLTLSGKGKEWNEEVGAFSSIYERLYSGDIILFCLVRRPCQVMRC